MLSFSVDGVPAPQGSKVRTRYGMRESSARVKPWREAVEAAIRRENREQMRAPYRVVVRFFIPRPKRTKATHPVAPSVGDLDKLVRSTLDAVTSSGLIVDDRYVVEIVADKQWAGVDGPGAVIHVEECRDLAGVTVGEGAS